MSPSIKMFTCPKCEALYHVVKVERGLETVDREVACLSCKAPLPGREADFVLKYFMLRKAGRRKFGGANKKPRTEGPGQV